MINKNAKWYLVGILFIANFFIWNAIFAAERNVLTVAFLDVGQGDAIFIEAPNGNQVLIDGGRGRQVLAELGAIMPLYDHTIDVVLATHPDADHIGGLPDVFARYEVDTYMHSGAESETNVYVALARAVEREGSRVVLAHAGQRIVLGDGAAMDILYPEHDARGMESNAASIIVRLSYGNSHVLLTGDSPKRIERYLVTQYGDALNADILKAGHHGSRTSSSPIFLAAVHPAYAVISAGADNRYGHPHEEVIERLREIGARILETAQLGSAVFTSNGKQISVQ